MISAINSFSDPNGQQSKKVLIVEDDPQWQVIMNVALKTVDDHIRVRCVKNVNHARQILSLDPDYDMIIADHYLEGDATGLDFWRDCTKQNRTIPFILVSGLSHEMFAKLVVNDNAEALTYLAKPLELHQFQQLVSGRLSEPVAKKKSIFQMTEFIAMACLFTAFPIFSSIQNSDSNVERSTALNIIPKAKLAVDQSQIEIRHVDLKDVIIPQLKKQIEQVVLRAEKINASVSVVAEGLDRKRR